MNRSIIFRLSRRALPVVFLTLFITACGPNDRPHVAVSVSPNASMIPANTLRLYVSFSEPMSRGQVLSYIYLENEAGEKVVSPFLNLNTELWNKDQTRLTLLFDPGRVKQGVGPNEAYGTPLLEGREYTLVVSKDMQTAQNEHLGMEHHSNFKIGPAERRAIRPEYWELQLPQSPTRSTLMIKYDRIIDVGAGVSLLKIKDEAGSVIKGKAISDGMSWSFIPSEPWNKGSYELIIPPSLEDVAGNTPYATFDANTGTMGSIKQPIALKFDIPSNPHGHIYKSP